MYICIVYIVFTDLLSKTNRAGSEHRWIYSVLPYWVISSTITDWDSHRLAAIIVIICMIIIIRRASLSLSQMLVEHLGALSNSWHSSRCDCGTRWWWRWRWLLLISAAAAEQWKQTYSGHYVSQLSSNKTTTRLQTRLRLWLWLRDCDSESCLNPHLLSQASIAFKVCWSVAAWVAGKYNKILPQKCL